MKERELLKQLNSLKSIKPDYEWKKNNREILLSKIYDSQVENGSSIKIGIFDSVKQRFSFPVLRIVSQPVFAVVLIAFFILSGGVVGIKASKDAKPGDSLYIAKIISEKTQLAITTDEKKKAQLGIEFAGNRAWELSRVLAEEKNGEKQEKVDKLVDSFKKEISGVKTRLEKINIDTKVAQKNETEGVYQEEAGDEEGMQVFSAQLGKEENGIQISEPTSTSVDTDSVIVKEDTEEETIEISTSTILDDAEVSEAAEESDDTVSSSASTEEILIAAGELLESEDYEGAIAKLDEADEAIVGVDEGEVKGETEIASSTEDGLNDINIDTGEETDNSASSTSN